MIQDPDLYKELSLAIQRSYISVINTPYETIYELEYIDITGNPAAICFYGRIIHSGPNMIYAQYAIFINDTAIAQATRSFSLMGKTKKIGRAEKDAARIESLMRQCSKKIRQQEYISQQNHMLKNIMLDHDNIH